MKNLWKKQDDAFIERMKHGEFEGELIDLKSQRKSIFWTLIFIGLLIIYYLFIHDNLNPTLTLVFIALGLRHNQLESEIKIYTLGELVFNNKLKNRETTNKEHV